MGAYICSLCKQPTTPRLSIVGVTADCHEARLEVEDEDRNSIYEYFGVSHKPEYRLITEQEERELAGKIEDDQKWDAVERKAND